jgi:hypothetical protein
MIIAEGRQGKLAQASGVNDRRYKRDIQQSKRERERKIEREKEKRLQYHPEVKNTLPKQARRWQ